jgi:ribosomal protein S27E
MNINKESAYLKGLLEGYELDSNKKETKLFQKMLDLIDEMADHITALEADNAELREYIEELDEDLGAVEEYLYEDDEDEDYYEDEEDDDDDFYEVECPSCGEVVCFDSSVDPDDVTCPACGEKFSCVCDCENCDACDEE